MTRCGNTDPKLQEVLDWVKQKSESVATAYKPAAIRACYLSRARAHFRARTLALRTLARARTLALARALAEPELQRQLQELSDQLPTVAEQNWENVRAWWRSNGQTWTDQLRRVMVDHRNIGHDWRFTPKQQQKLEQYYEANQFLVGCLKQPGVSATTREEIEASLLLPIADLENSEFRILNSGG